MTFTPLEEIELYFRENPPTKTMMLSPAERIDEPAKFVEAHIETLKGKNKKRIYNPYFSRLHAFYIFCKEGIEPVI